ncbi:uncharacterized transposon-derived, partial [Paramuricea clavata]
PLEVEDTNPPEYPEGAKVTKTSIKLDHGKRLSKPNWLLDEEKQPPAISSHFRGLVLFFPNIEKRSVLHEALNHTAELSVIELPFATQIKNKPSHYILRRKVAEDSIIIYSPDEFMSIIRHALLNFANRDLSKLRTATVIRDNYRDNTGSFGLISVGLADISGAAGQSYFTNLIEVVRYMQDEKEDIYLKYVDEMEQIVHDSKNNQGSNWIILNIESHYVNIAMYKPLKGSSYMKLPADISNPKCGLINMKNEDNKCFMWSHVRHVRPKVRRATTITRQDVKFSENLDYEGIDFPVKISDIDKIERRNCISISVFGYKGDERKVDPESSEEKSTTDLYQTHKACSFGLKTVCHYDDQYSGEYISYVGEDATNVFLKTVLKESIRCREMVNKIFKKKMVITPEQEAEFWMTRNCSICGNDLGKSLVFIDSIQFMASSSEALVSNLSPEDFRIVGKRWTGEDFKLVTQKGIFPYEYLDDKFYSSLYESEVKEEDYQRALKVWDHFKMKTMRDYHDLYLETDVLLLADVFENFRRTCLENYKLDPAHYISAPSLSWDAFLKQSGEEIELVSDMDMFQFFEKGMRGGPSQTLFSSYLGNPMQTGKVQSV